jgi:hypothetical protein
MMKKKTSPRLSRKELERLEDEIDLKLALKAMKEKGPRIPWEQIKKEMGL